MLRRSHQNHLRQSHRRISQRPTHVIRSCSCHTSCSLSHLSRDGCPQGLDQDRGAPGSREDTDTARSIARSSPDTQKVDRTRGEPGGGPRLLLGQRAGYVINRVLQEWGHACDVTAPSLTSTQPCESEFDGVDHTALVPEPFGPEIANVPFWKSMSSFRMPLTSSMRADSSSIT